MLSLAGIVIPRRLSGVVSGMPAEIERMPGDTGWAVLGRPLLTLFLDAFARYTLTAGRLSRTGLGN